jgi:chemotaxis signal transduction protein
MASLKDTYLLLDVAGVDMALPMTAVAEILPVTRFDRQAPWPKVLAGFMNLRGRPLAVIDLARVMNPQREPSEPDLYSHVIRLDAAHGGGRLALLVDRAKDAEVAADGFTEIDDDTSANGVICGNLLILGRLTPLIDMNRLLLIEEEVRVAEIAEALRTRLETSGSGES